MSQQMTQTLPLLPLTSGVVLPGMVFTMALETEDAQVATEAAGNAGGRLGPRAPHRGEVRIGRGRRRDR